MTRASMNRILSRRGMVVGSLSALLAGAAVAIPAGTRGEMYPGTRVNGIDLSGMSPSASEALLRTSLRSFEDHAVTYTFDGLQWQAGLADIGMAIDYEGMVRQAMRHGRDGGLVDRYTALVADAERDIPLLFRRNDAVLSAYLSVVADSVAIEPRDARLDLRDGEIAITKERAGRRLDLAQAMTDTIRGVRAGETVTIELSAISILPETTTADRERAREQVERMVSAPVLFTHGGDTYPVAVETLMSALVIRRDSTARFDPKQLAPRIDAIAEAVFAPPQNVKLGWDGGLYVVEDDVDGVQIDRKRLEAMIPELARGVERTAPLPVQALRAEARTDNVDALGIAGHLATGSSSFAGSSGARAENVAVSARNISYKLVAPGEQFSFNRLLGPISLDNGFVEGTIIQGDWTASDLGGGVCQVSTTVFRAAALAGFQFDEWHPHSWRLDFYELDGSPPGFDGAIYQPNTPEEIEKDLSFHNPLDSWLLLQVLIDGDTVSAHFYGTTTGWTVELGEPHLSEPKPIPAPVERVNPDLAPGERVMVQTARAGVTVNLRRTVIAPDGTVISDGDFVSDYRSVPEAWEVGPG